MQPAASWQWENQVNRRSKSALAAASLAALLALSLPVPGAAQSQVEPEPGERERAEELAREGMERIMRALEMLMQSIPQYELPEINDNGDIIIRRRQPPEGGETQPPEPEPDSADT
jgi:hypothetical protein